jgi:hypothetical protein
MPDRACRVEDRCPRSVRRVRDPRRRFIAAVAPTVPTKSDCCTNSGRRGVHPCKAASKLRFSIAPRTSSSPVGSARKPNNNGNLNISGSWVQLLRRSSVENWYVGYRGTGSESTARRTRRPGDATPPHQPWPQQAGDRPRRADAEALTTPLARLCAAYTVLSITTETRDRFHPG